jgi:hypothetical protein
MEEVSSVHLQLTAAELPIRSQQVVESKDFVLEIVELTAADEAKVRHVLLSFERIDTVALRASAKFQSNCSNVPARQRALTKPVPASPKDGSQNAIAWRFRPIAVETRAVAMAERARCFRYADCY